jgi:hypothetical protein
VGRLADLREVRAACRPPNGQHGPESTAQGPTQRASFSGRRRRAPVARRPLGGRHSTPAIGRATPNPARVDRPTANTTRPRRVDRSTANTTDRPSSGQRPNPFRRPTTQRPPRADHSAADTARHRPGNTEPHASRPPNGQRPPNLPHEPTTQRPRQHAPQRGDRSAADTARQLSAGHAEPRASRPFNGQRPATPNPRVSTTQRPTQRASHQPRNTQTRASRPPNGQRPTSLMKGPPNGRHSTPHSESTTQPPTQRASHRPRNTQTPACRPPNGRHAARRARRPAAPTQRGLG